MKRLITLVALVAIPMVSLTADVDAGCRSRSYRRTTYVRPVQRVRVHVAPRVVVTPKPKLNLPTVPAGSTLTLPGNFLGEVPGSVLMVFNNIKLPVKVNRWSQTGVSITLPPMAIKEAVIIRLDVVLPQGKLGMTQKLRVTAPAPVVLHPVAPTSKLPTAPAIQQQVRGTAASPAVATGAPLVLPRANAPAANAPAASALPTGTPTNPIVLPAAQPNPQTRATAQQPIVLPAATAQTTAQTTNPQLTAQTPIVLPAAQPPAAPATSEAQNDAADAEAVDPLADNPILNELQAAEVEQQQAAPAPNAGSSIGFLGLLLNALQK